MTREEHARRMAEWRERNDGGDCGRVANELIVYIEEELMPGASRGELPDASREVLGEVVIRTPDVYRVTEGEHVFGQKVDP